MMKRRMILKKRMMMRLQVRKRRPQLKMTTTKRRQQRKRKRRRLKRMMKQLMMLRQWKKRMTRMQLKWLKMKMSLKVTTQQTTRMTQVTRRPSLTYWNTPLALCAASAPSVSTALVAVTSARVKRETSQLTVSTARDAHLATFAPFCVTQFAHQVAFLMRLLDPSLRPLHLYSERPFDSTMWLHEVLHSGSELSGCSNSSSITRTPSRPCYECDS